MQGTGGVRKYRVARAGRGKSGGVRVIYYCWTDRALFLIDVYAKNEKSDLSKAEKNKLRKLIAELK